MSCDIWEFIAANPTCARNKNSNQPPAGLLQLLPVPSRPLTHIIIDFVTGLPSSEGNTIIFTIIDYFSKAAHFIPLPIMSSAFETAQ